MTETLSFEILIIEIYLFFGACGVVLHLNYRLVTNTLKPI